MLEVKQLAVAKCHVYENFPLWFCKSVLVPILINTYNWPQLPKRCCINIASVLGKFDLDWATKCRMTNLMRRQIEVMMANGKHEHNVV